MEQYLNEIRFQVKHFICLNLLSVYSYSGLFMFLFVVEFHEYVEVVNNVTVLIRFVETTF